jgi:hypothetical protein
MAKNNNVKDFTKDIADAIRAQTGETNKINPQNFSEKISKLNEGKYVIEQIFDVDGCELHITDAVTTKKHRCCVIDYDGTFLKDEYLATGEVFELPTLPQHDRLLFQAWTNSANIVNNSVTVENEDVVIRPIYTTKSGLTEFDIDLNSVTNSVYEKMIFLYMNGTKDWGDGTVDDKTTHTYASYGKYTITCNGDTFNRPSIDYSVFGLIDYTWNLCTEIRVGPNIIDIPENIFVGSNKLKTITLHNNITSVAGISDVAGLENFTIPNGLSVFNGISGATRLNLYVIPNNITTLGRCFTPNTKLLKISNNITSYVGRTFESAFTLKNYNIPDKITNLESYVFSDCINLEIVDIGSVGNLPDYMFNNCYSLQHVTIKDGVTNVGQNVFKNCYSLRYISLPDTISAVGKSCFYGCKSLQDVKLPKSLTTLQPDLFYGCDSLKKIHVPKNVGSLESGCLRNTNLDVLDFSEHTTVPTLKASFGDYAGFIIIVPDNLYAEWVEASNWSQYKDVIKKLSEVAV